MPPDAEPHDQDLEQLFTRAHRLRQSTERAWAELYHACYPHVLRVAHRHLDRSLRSTYDAADFAADVMLDLVRDFDRFDFPSFDALIAYLQAQAEYKIRQARRRRDAT